MHSRMLALVAIGLSLAACSSTKPSGLPMAPIPLPPPQACAVACPPLPTLDEAGEGAAVLWVYEVVDAAGQCRRMHDECRAARSR